MYENIKVIHYTFNILVLSYNFFNWYQRQHTKKYQPYVLYLYIMI